MTEKKTFKIDLADLAPTRKSVSSVFSAIDKHFLSQFHERRDMIRCYRDIPIALNQLYTESDYILKRHGQDLQVTIDLHPIQKAGQKKRRRQVTLVKESFSAEEEHVF